MIRGIKTQLTNNPLDVLIKANKGQLLTTSRIYAIIRPNIDYNSHTEGRSRWPSIIPNTTITQITTAYLKHTKAVYFQDVALRLLHRAYVSPKIVHKIGLTQTPNCAKYNHPDTTLEHALWSCTK